MVETSSCHLAHPARADADYDTALTTKLTAC